MQIILNKQTERFNGIVDKNKKNANLNVINIT